MLNCAGYYDGLLAFFDNAVEEGFLRPEASRALHSGKSSPNSGNSPSRFDFCHVFCNSLAIPQRPSKSPPRPTSPSPAHTLLPALYPSRLHFPYSLLLPPLRVLRTVPHTRVYLPQCPSGRASHASERVTRVDAPVRGRRSQARRIVVAGTNAAELIDALAAYTPPPALIESLRNKAPAEA